MTTDFERVLHAHLRPAADDTPGTDFDALVERTTRLGIRRRNRHRVAAVTCAATVAVVALVAVAAVPRLWAGPGRVSPAASATASAPWADLTQRAWPAALSPPAASGAATATAEPAVVGSDPGLLHLSLAAPPGSYVNATWESGPGYESVQLVDDTQLARAAATGSGDDAEAMVTVSPRQETLRPALPAGAVSHGTVAVGTSTATEYRTGDGEFYLRWQAGSGPWVQVLGLTDEAKLRAVADAVRLDTVTRCVVPFRLAHLPSGLTPRTCQLSLGITSHYGYGSGRTTATYQFADSHGATKLEVLVDPPTSGPCTGANTTLSGGRTAVWLAGLQGAAPSQNGQLSLCQPVGGYPLRIRTDAPYGHDDAVTVANNLSVPPGVTGPTTWPTHPTG